MSDAGNAATPGEQEWKEEQGIGTETPADSEPTERATVEEDDNPEGNTGDAIPEGDE
jgi:hypothetical protein